MTLDPGDVVWLFDGRGGMSRILSDLVGGLMVSMQQLMPPSALNTFDDPFSALAADDAFRASTHVTGLRLARLFPRHTAPEFDQKGDEWEGLVRARSVSMHSDARQVLAEIEEAGQLVPVREASVNPWLRTLGALRVAWHADLVGSEVPDVAATQEQLEQNPALATLLDWLAYQLEDLITTREACELAGTGLDISDIEDWD